MTTRMLATFLVSLILSYLVIPPTPQIQAKPILKPRKYHGPIPRKYFTYSIGFLGGADNADMWDFLDRSVAQPFRRFLSTSDFSTGAPGPECSARGLVVPASISTPCWAMRAAIASQAAACSPEKSGNSRSGSNIGIV